jgi:hypothetical protein
VSPLPEFHPDLWRTDVNSRERIDNILGPQDVLDTIKAMSLT